MRNRRLKGPPVLSPDSSPHALGTAGHQSQCISYRGCLGTLATQLGSLETPSFLGGVWFCLGQEVELRIEETSFLDCMILTWSFGTATWALGGERTLPGGFWASCEHKSAEWSMLTSAIRLVSLVC